MIRGLWLVAIFLQAWPVQGQDLGAGTSLYSSGWVPSTTQDVTIYGPMELERRGGKVLEDILVSDESVHMIRGSGASGRSAAFIQGLDGDHILFLVDGVEVNDPISPGRSFELSQMPTADIERIEIIKGGDGIRRGSGANAAVINIVTKQGVQKKPLKLGLEAGSYGALRARVNASLGNKDHSVNFGLGANRADGISAASQALGNSEADGYLAKNGSLRLRSKISHRNWIDLASRYQVLTSQLDNYGGPGGDDPNHQMRTTESTLRGRYEHGGERDIWQAKIMVGGNRIIREQDNPVDADHLESAESGYFAGTSETIEGTQAISLEANGKLLNGFSLKRERGQSRYQASAANADENTFGERSALASGLWLQYLTSERHRFFSDIGLRLENHDRAGALSGHHLGLGMRTANRLTLLRARLEKGYKVPTLYQLYSAYGRSDLNSESSLSWNFGVEHSLDIVELKLGIFKHLLTDLVDFDAATLKYQNIGGVEAHGCEVAAESLWIDEVTVRVGYGWTEHLNLVTGKALLRRPKHKATIDVSSFIGSQLRHTVSLLYVGPRSDLDFAGATPTEVVLGEYAVLSSSLQYSISSDFEVYVRGENLTNKSYEEVSGYGTPGRSGSLGATLAL